MADDIIVISDSDEDEVSSSTEAAKKNSLLLSLQEKILDTWSKMDNSASNVVIKKEKDAGEHEVSSATSMGQPEVASVNIKKELPWEAEPAADDHVTSQNKLDDCDEFSDETIVFSDDSTTYDLFPQKRKSKDNTTHAESTLEWDSIKTKVEEKFTAANETITPIEMEICLSTLSKLFKSEDGAAATTSTPKMDTDPIRKKNQHPPLRRLTIPLVRIDATAHLDRNAPKGEYKLILRWVLHSELLYFKCLASLFKQ